MNKTLFTVPLMILAALLVFSGTVIAHEGEEHGKEKYEEGSGGSSMEMDHKSGGHEYKGEHGGEAEKHSKEYYDQKYGKYDHEKKELQEEGSGMKDDAHRMKEEQERKEEGSR